MQLLTQGFVVTMTKRMQEADGFFGLTDFDDVARLQIRQRLHIKIDNHLMSLNYFDANHHVFG